MRTFWLEWYLTIDREYVVDNDDREYVVDNDDREYVVDND